MARNRDPFTQALSSLRERIQSGLLPGGAPVIVQDEARRLRLSTTPIREALARLSGEGFVDRAPSGGYVTMRFDAPAVRDRYAMHGEYLHFAIRLNGRALDGAAPPLPSTSTSTPGEEAPGFAVDRFFSSIVCSAGNQVLWEGYTKVSRQLETLRRLEPLVFDDLHSEAAALHDAYVRDFGSAFSEVSDRFHARRVAAAGVLAALLRQQELSASGRADVLKQQA